MEKYPCSSRKKYLLVFDDELKEAPKKGKYAGEKIFICTDKYQLDTK